MKSLS